MLLVLRRWNRPPSVCLSRPSGDCPKLRLREHIAKAAQVVLYRVVRPCGDITETKHSLLGLLEAFEHVDDLILLV